MKVKIGDKVKVIVGKDKGKEGDVTKIMRTKNQVVVDGLNLYKRHKKTQGQEGGIIEFAAPMDASNVKIISSKK